jgi:hypothetical protein
MDVQEFARYHLPALETDEVRFNVQIAVLSAVLAGSSGQDYWTLGGPGHCATRSPRTAFCLAHSIVPSARLWPSRRKTVTTPA